MTIELLSPAKNADIGIEAILHGADAVYIGASEFGARHAAGNSIEDIERLVNFAHIYRAKVYVTVNTIIKEDELKRVEHLITKLYNIGVDALIIQDLAILKLNIPPIALHASTQMHNTTPQKVKFLEDIGFSQVVLARECTKDDIVAIRKATSVRLEAFIHGALCVSYSGRCYASAALTGRSANRGECAQICRLPFFLQDAHGHNLGSRHYLSLKDMDHSEDIEEMIASGITSFKIEGRLKDVDYVKNITAYYRGIIDEVLKRHKDWERSSDGVTELTFTPNKFKSFFRGGTKYFYGGRNLPGGLDSENTIYSINTPKSIGEFIGTVNYISGKKINVESFCEIHNGDGFCFFDEKNNFFGFRVNKVEKKLEAKNIWIVETLDTIPIKNGCKLYRNYDIQFQSILEKPTATRRIPIIFELKNNILSISDGVNSASINIKTDNSLANKDQTENIKSALNKLGDTPYIVSEIKIDTKLFFPLGILSASRREIVEKLTQLRCQRALDEREKFIIKNSAAQFPFKKADYTENISNSLAKAFYAEHGVEKIEEAFEILQPQTSVPLMYCKHCIRYAIGACKKEGTKLSKEIAEPLHLIYKNYYLRLEFDCKSCQMKVYKE